MNDNRWKAIWERREDELGLIDKQDEKAVFLELKRIDGFDVLDGALELQYQETKKSLRLKKGGSVFEVGCGCGANLYLFRKEGFKVGGLDYSKALVGIMKKVFADVPLQECICDSADHLPIEIKYDAVFSNSVFSYFPDYAYANRVLERMIEKAQACVGILDIHDKAKEKAFLNYRMKTIPDYKEKYKGLPKLFYEKSFFTDFAESHNMRIEFSEFQMDGYWNNEFVFHCFLYKKGKHD